MYKTEKDVKRFNFTVDDDLEEYKEILNDPLCSIIEERKVTHTETHFNDGKPAGTTKIDYMVITWEKRTLL